MNKKHNVFFLAFIIIFSLVLLSSQMVMGINAKFISADSASDSASVAKFKVEVNVTDTTNVVKTAPCVMMPGDSEELIVVVTSNSDVALKGKVTITTANNLPLEIEYLNSEFTLDAGANSCELSFNINWDAADNDIKYNGEVDVLIINVSVEQVD